MILFCCGSDADVVTDNRVIVIILIVGLYPNTGTEYNIVRDGMVLIRMNE